MIESFCLHCNSDFEEPEGWPYFECCPACKRGGHTPREEEDKTVDAAYRCLICWAEYQEALDDITRRFRE